MGLTDTQEFTVYNTFNISGVVTSDTNNGSTAASYDSILNGRSYNTQCAVLRNVDSTDSVSEISAKYNSVMVIGG
jgi:hypothetical protein